MKMGHKELAASNSSSKSKMRKSEYFKKAKRGLLAGLVLPALVLFGLVLGLETGRKFGSAHVFVFMLAGSLLGMLVGLIILIKVLECLYPPTRLSKA